jgi:hypothetical protein
MIFEPMAPENRCGFADGIFEGRDVEDDGWFAVPFHEAKSKQFARPWWEATGSTHFDRAPETSLFGNSAKLAPEGCPIWT